MEILSLGEKIKSRRKELNMTLKDLAGDRITPGQISLVESGKSNPSMDLLEYLSQTLNTTVEFLMESEETQAEKICLYFEDLAEFYILNENYMLGEKYIEKALYYSEKYKLEYRKARGLYLRSIIHIEKGEMALAQQFLLSCNAVFIRNNCYEDVINVFIKLGKISINLKAFHSAFSYFKQAEKVFIDNYIGNDFLLGEIYYFVALTYFNLDNTEKAMNYSYLAKEKFSQINNKKEYAKSLLLIADEFAQKGDIGNAIRYSKKSLKTYKSLNDVEYLGDIENSLGKLFYEFDNLEESFVHFNNAREIREKNSDSKLIITLNNLCENYIKCKDIEKAKKILDEINSFTGRSGSEDIINYYLLKFKVDVLENRNGDAKETLIYAFDYAKNVGNIKKAGEIAITIGKFYLDTGNDKEAAKYLNQGVEIFKEQGILN